MQLKCKQLLILGKAWAYCIARMFGGKLNLADCLRNSQIESRQNILLAYNMYGDPILNHQIKIHQYICDGPNHQLNSHQHFWLYGNYFVANFLEFYYEYAPDLVFHKCTSMSALTTSLQGKGGDYEDISDSSFAHAPAIGHFWVADRSILLALLFNWVFLAL